MKAELPATKLTSQGVYGSVATYRELPDANNTTKGVVPLDTLPAAWWNALWNAAGQDIDAWRAQLASIRAEISNVLAAAMLSPSDASDSQLLSAIQTLRKTIATATVAGAVTSGSDIKEVSVDPTTGKMSVNAMADWADNRTLAEYMADQDDTIDAAITAQNTAIANAKTAQDTKIDNAISDQNDTIATALAGVEDAIKSKARVFVLTGTIKDATSDVTVRISSDVDTPVELDFFDVFVLHVGFASSSVRNNCRTAVVGTLLDHIQLYDTTLGSPAKLYLTGTHVTYTAIAEANGINMVGYFAAPVANGTMNVIGLTGEECELGPVGRYTIDSDYLTYHGVIPYRHNDTVLNVPLHTHCYALWFTQVTGIAEITAEHLYACSMLAPSVTAYRIYVNIADTALGNNDNIVLHTGSIDFDCTVSYDSDTESLLFFLPKEVYKCSAHISTAARINTSVGATAMYVSRDTYTPVVFTAIGTKHNLYTQHQLRISLPTYSILRNMTPASPITHTLIDTDMDMASQGHGVFMYTIPVIIVYANGNNDTYSALFGSVSQAVPVPSLAFCVIGSRLDPDITKSITIGDIYDGYTATNVKKVFTDGVYAWKDYPTSVDSLCCSALCSDEARYIRVDVPRSDITYAHTFYLSLYCLWKYYETTAKAMRDYTGPLPRVHCDLVVYTNTHGTHHCTQLAFDTTGVTSSRTIHFMLLVDSKCYFKLTLRWTAAGSAQSFDNATCGYTEDMGQSETTASEIMVQGKIFWADLFSPNALS